MLFGKDQDTKKNTAELRKYLPNINTSFDFEKLRNFIDSSSDKYIRPVLGDELYNNLPLAIKNTGGSIWLEKK